MLRIKGTPTYNSIISLPISAYAFRCGYVDKHLSDIPTLDNVKESISEKEILYESKRRETHTIHSMMKKTEKEGFQNGTLNPFFYFNTGDSCRL